jgi:hypothetical protein
MYYPPARRELFDPIMSDGGDTVGVPLQRGYHVYRVWAADGVCLYIGKAGLVIECPRRHAREREWWPEAVRTDYRSMSGRAATAA